MTTLDSAPGTSGPAQPEGAPPQTPVPQTTAPQTTVPQRRERLNPPQRRPLTLLRLGDVLSVVGALLAAVASTGLLWFEISPFSGAIGAVVVCWILFVL